MGWAGCTLLWMRPGTTNPPGRASEKYLRNNLEENKRLFTTCLWFQSYYVAEISIIRWNKLGSPQCVVMSVWAKTRRVFRHKERHWREKISCDGWAGSRHAHRFFFHCTTPWLIEISRVQTAFEGGGQVSLGQRAEGGRIVGGTVSDPRVVIDPSVGHKESTYSFCFARPSIASESQDLKLDFSSHTSDMTSDGGPWTLTRHDIYTASEH